MQIRLSSGSPRPKQKYFPDFLDLFRLNLGYAWVETVENAFGHCAKEDHSWKISSKSIPIPPRTNNSRFISSSLYRIFHSSLFSFIWWKKFFFFSLYRNEEKFTSKSVLWHPISPTIKSLDGFVRCIEFATKLLIFLATQISFKTVLASLKKSWWSELLRALRDSNSKKFLQP